MYALRYFLLFAFFSLNLPLFSQVKSNDTVFIERSAKLKTAQSIYFDNNKNSKAYRDIVDFLMDKFDVYSYRQSLAFLKENKLKLTKKKPIIPFVKWVPVKQFKGKFYAYHPCDFYSHYKISFNDSTFIDWTGEGPVANKIVAQKKVDSKTYEFRLKGFYQPNRMLSIYIIDVVKNIAVFEETNEKHEKTYYLMIAANQIKTLPLIVNNCETHKQNELKFEEPEFKKLLKRK
ncbi:MAG: hypothetical protein EOO07_18345 [Chitinophagaceae bacterium]|nr:MAG: hypothetical protein EOO07_18345 [Chitinophagaceae bacterium]